jgi:competence protein ComEC
MGFFVLPVGLFSLFILPLHGELAAWGIQLAGGGLSFALDGLQALNTFDGIALTTFVPSALEIICYYGLLGLIVMKHMLRPAPWLLPILLVVMIADGCYWGYERFWHGDLRVTVLDVGQGSAALVEFPGGGTMMIDGGGYTDNRYFDVGERIVAPFLRYRKIMRVDTIVLSHPSSDHMNGLVYILAHFHPKKLLWTGDGVPTASFHDFHQVVVDSGVQVPVFEQMDREVTIGGVDVIILNPPAIGAQPHHDLSGEECNNRSLVLKLKMGTCGILFPGDIEVRAEEGLLACCRSELASRVLVAPHHGSRTSSSMDFLRAVDPEAVVISAGWLNRFGFPHASVLERYRALATHIYRTDCHGAVSLRSDGRRWRTETQLK